MNFKLKKNYYKHTFIPNKKSILLFIIKDVGIILKFCLILEQNTSCITGKLQITIIDLVKVTYYNLVVKMHEIVI